MKVPIGGEANNKENGIVTDQVQQDDEQGLYNDTKWKIMFHTYLNPDGGASDVGHSFVSIVNDGQIVASAGMWPADDYMGSMSTGLMTIPGRLRSEIPSMNVHADNYDSQTGQSSAKNDERLKTDSFNASEQEVARLMAHIDKEYDKNGDGQQYNMYGSDSNPNGPHNCSTWARNALKVAFTPTTGQPTQAQQQKLQRIKNYQPSSWTITRPSKIFNNIQGIGLEDPYKLRKSVEVSNTRNDDQPFNVNAVDNEVENAKAAAMKKLIKQGKKDLGIENTEPGKFFQKRQQTIQEWKIQEEEQRKRLEKRMAQMKKQARTKQIQKDLKEDRPKPKRRKSTTDIKPIKPKNIDIDPY